jgi:hypothetical protein
MSSYRSSQRAATLRRDPRISVNKLGEYLVATAARRRQILIDQKRPSDFKVIRYTDAQRAIVDYLVNWRADPDVLSRHLSRLANWSQGPQDSEYDVQKNRACREAIEAFARVADILGLGGVEMNAGNSDCPKLNKAGVEVSVRPELILRGADRTGDRFVGALKLHISKSFPLNEKAGEYVATILHEFSESYLAAGSPCLHRHCYVLDVFAGKLYTAPKCFTRRRSDVLAACAEIALVWQSL